ncbi:MAG: sigma-70 family RNA polymerase sigma factor, partial [Anaerolineae bacterium]
MPNPTEATHLSGARRGNPRDFENLVEPYRAELRLHCYRMLGSLLDADDMLQETLLRAWQRLDTFEARAPFRAWLYKIATNACLDALKRRARRSLPALTHPPANPGEPFAPPAADPVWLEPFTFAVPVLQVDGAHIGGIVTFLAP